MSMSVMANNEDSPSVCKKGAALTRNHMTKEWQFVVEQPSATSHGGDWKSFFCARTMDGVASSNKMI